MEINNTDIFGVKRGICKNCAECPQYIFSDSYICAYCGCVPSKHAKIENDHMDINGKTHDSTTSHKTDFDLTNRNFEYKEKKNSEELNSPENSSESDEDSETNSETNSEISHRPEGPSEQPTILKPFSNLPLEMQSKAETLSHLIPDNINGTYEADENAGLYTSANKNESNRAVRTIASNMKKAGFTLAKDAAQVAILAIEKFPGLKGAHGKPHEKVEKRLNNCLKNKRRLERKRSTVNKSQNASKKTKSNENSSALSQDENLVLLLQEEWRKLNRDIGRIKELLTRTRDQRMLDAKKFSASQMLEKYPALSDKELFIWEFVKMVDIPLKIMRRNLSNAVPKLCNLIEVKPEKETKNMMIHLLENFDELFGSKGKGGNIIQMNVTEIVPSKDKPPFLIAADIDGRQLKCYVDAEPMHCSDPLEAVLLLIASYYVFNISYDKVLKFKCSLLENVIFGRHTSRLVPPKWRYLLVTNILEKAGIQ